eukprot:CAMPEP_0172908426 /NCGR_PEP_ID=MMETSP1075-20121228/180671_1 /TAXON_ID=2916 /ORGANISM="Ceratium fusus, Strain PA161109" /LENGTH=60 /DNA_ID=CAMNT_0013766191 /DNA_START=17 /DNA_END=196 /DNA_ORIENTATION=+
MKVKPANTLAPTSPAPSCATTSGLARNTLCRVIETREQGKAHTAAMGKTEPFSENANPTL